MNGYSILFAGLVILAIAIIIGTVALTLLGGFRIVTQPPWHRHGPHHHRP